MGKLKIWAQEEDEILIKISHTIKSKKWKKASEELKKCGFERTDVQCRQRYINHLDPCVNKQLWSQEELEILYSKYSQYGNRWFLLQKHLPGRTQTKIKNYFYGNIRYFLKIIIKNFLKKSTGFINDIKTQILLDMYEAKNGKALVYQDFEGFTIIPRSIKKMKYKVEKNICQKLIRDDENSFYEFTQHFLKNYTEKSLKKKQQSQNQDLKEEQENDADRNQKQSSDSQKMLETIVLKKVICEPDHKKMNIVSTVNGLMQKGKQEELEYLKKMAISHFSWYQHYQKAYMTMLFEYNKQ